MSTQIKKLTIEAFRGIPYLELDLEGKSLLLRGDNGTGKSSIVDAIEFFFSGKVSHLEGVQGLSLQRHGPHVSFSTSNVSIGITFDPGNITLTRSFAARPACPPQFAQYFEVAQTGSFILRRAQILEFIVSQPAERFRAIGSIIGIEELDAYELELMRLRDSLEAKVTSKRTLHKQGMQELSSILEREINTYDDILTALNDVLKGLNLPTVKSLEHIDEHAEVMLRSIKGGAALTRGNILEELLRTSAVQLINDKEVLETIVATNGKIRELLKDGAKKERSIADLLEAGRKVIQDWEMDTCPLCEQEINREELLNTIGKRIGTVKALSEKASEIRKACTIIKGSLEELSKRVTTLVSKSESIPELSEFRDKLKKNLEIINIFITKVDSSGEAEAEIPDDEFQHEVREISSLVNSIGTKCNELFASEKVTEEEKKVLKAVGLIQQTKMKVEELRKISGELIANEKYYKMASKLYSAFTSIKKAKVQDVFNVIQQDMQKFYSMLHPDDPHKNIQLKLPTGRRASIELKIESFGRKDEDPRAFTSEGHLDSLGLCIFLSFVKKFNAGCSLIILDDVVTTVDAGHRENICKLLHNEFADRQLIITTHEGLWYEQLRASQRALGVEGNFKCSTVTKWDLETGPVIRPYKPRWERIQERIAAGDKSAGNEGRIYLEWVLETICEAAEAPVPFRGSRRYEVWDLLPSAKQRLENLVKDAGFKAKITTVFQDLESTVIYGNILSHNNPMAEALSIEEIDRFCGRVHNLYCTFLCPSCGHLLHYYRDLKIIRCSNSNCASPLEIKTK